MELQWYSLLSYIASFSVIPILIQQSGVEPLGYPGHEISQNIMMDRPGLNGNAASDAGPIDIAPPPGEYASKRDEDPPVANPTPPVANPTLAERRSVHALVSSRLSGHLSEAYKFMMFIKRSGRTLGTEHVSSMKRLVALQNSLSDQD